MIPALPRAMLLLATRCLGDHRRDWAMAMEAECDAAAQDGQALRFAAGCLRTALRELPTHPQGRFALTSLALVLGLVMPFAALCLLGALLGFPFLAFGDVALGDVLAGSSRQLPLLNEGDWAMALPLTLLVVALAVGQLLLAWSVAERDWPRAQALQRFQAAGLLTLLILAPLLRIPLAPLLLPAAGLITEILAINALARWHDLVPRAPAPAG